jgi:3-hydroxybutyryl-CoA dehydrogenase
MEIDVSKRDGVVIGGGTMGADIAAIFIAEGRNVQIVESDSAVRKNLPCRVRLAADEIGLRGGAGKIVVRDAIAAVDWVNAEIVIECAFEALDVKRTVFRELERYAPRHLPLASNSSGFPITRIAEGLTTGDRMLGLHFFMPGHLVPCVEVIRGESTTPEVVEQAFASMEGLNKKPVRVKRDVPGFLANRIQHAMMREAIALVEQGFASAEDVDVVVRYGFGFRYVAAGPLLQKDLAGVDIHCAAASTMYPYLCNDTEVSPLMRNLVAEKKIGIKTKQGFYSWDDNSIAVAQAKYKSALQKALTILREADRE